MYFDHSEDGLEDDLRGVQSEERHVLWLLEGRQQLISNLLNVRHEGLGGEGDAVSIVSDQILPESAECVETEQCGVPLVWLAGLEERLEVCFEGGPVVGEVAGQDSHEAPGQHPGDVQVAAS